MDPVQEPKLDFWHNSRVQKLRIPALNVTELYPRIRATSLRLCTFLPYSSLICDQVLLLIVFNGYCTQYFVIFPWLGPSLETHVRLLPLNLLLVMVWVTYYLAIATDPGRVPPWYEPSETSAGKAGLRWCKKCKVFKPYDILVNVYSW
jgi:hypothetical protein